MPEWQVDRKIESQEARLAKLEQAHAVTRRDVEMLSAEIGSVRQQIALGQGEERERHRAVMRELHASRVEISEARGGLKFGRWLARTGIALLAVIASIAAYFNGVE